MITDAERMRLKKLFSDTISLLCRSGLPGACAHRVDALIGVTLDNQEVVLVNFSENFWQENDEHTVRSEIADEKKTETRPSPTPENPVPSGACSYGIKDEFEASQDPCNASALVIVPDRVYGNDVNLNNNFHNPIENIELQCTMSDNQDRSEFDRLLPDFEKTSATESDSDCLVIKTELSEDATKFNNVSTESENFIASSAGGDALSSVPAVHRSSYGSLSMRMKHVHSMQRHARRNTFGYKFYRPQQRYSNASYPSQVSCSNKSNFVSAPL